MKLLVLAGSGVVKELLRLTCSRSVPWTRNEPPRMGRFCWLTMSWTTAGMTTLKL